MKNIIKKAIILSFLITAACAAVLKVEAAVWNFPERAPDRKVSTLALRFAKENNVPENFEAADLKGEQVSILEAKPDNLNNLKLSITLPAGHKFLTEGLNSLRLYTENGKLFKSFKIKGLNSSLTVNDHIKSKRAFAQVTLYYCREGNKGMCMVKTILFTIPLKSNDQGADWELQYTVLP